MTDRTGQHPLAPDPAPHPLDHAGVRASGHASADEGDAARSSAGAGEDPARRVGELMPARRRPDPEPTLSIFPDQVHVGDRFTNADGDWEVMGRPVTFKGTREVRARVQRPGDPGTGARVHVADVRALDDPPRVRPRARPVAARAV
jgi:hypothetical protein